MVGRPSVWLVSPAWRRFAVTRLALAQRAHLATVLAARGIDCHTVVVADDENLEIAAEYGCATVELDNSGLGRRFNAGFRFAAGEGADWLVHIGSDDWVHPDLFTPLLAPLEPRPIISGRRIAFVDLLTARISRATLDGPTGVIPWILPRHLLEPCGFEPIRPERMHGIDGDLVRGLRRTHVRAQWVFHDPHDIARVDFKSDVNINTFAALRVSLTGTRRSDPWAALAAHYPAELVDMARRTHDEINDKEGAGHMPKLRTPDGRIVSVSQKGRESLLTQGYTDYDETAAATPRVGASTAELEDLRAQTAALEAELADAQAKIAELGTDLDEAQANADAALSFGDFSKEALEVEAEKKEVAVTGTGANGNVKKDDLVAALEAHAAGGGA